MLISCWNQTGMDDDGDDGEAFALGMMDDDDASLVLSTIFPRSQDEEEDDDDVVAIDARADGRANAANENAVAGTNRSRMGMRRL